MKKNYKATIITPFHNTDLSVFQTTVRSVLAQTVGFENIEWIVVLHNCTQEYVDGVRALLGGYENVVLKELKNSARSASSPRNYGLQFVSAPYLEFLDSDDTISPDTVEVCLSVMQEHHPDLVVFRMAYVRENDKVISVITDITLWDPLEREIVLTGDEIRSRPELYSTINFCTHNRFFDMDFLRRHNFRFDEQITMAEDAFFTLSCYMAASKIVVLPQFVGHRYFVNSVSAVQSPQKTPEQVLHFSYGFKKIFDLLLEHHAYYNHFFLTVLQAYIHFAIASPGFTAEDWKQLQADMRPYAELLTPPPVNKFYTQEQGQLLYDFITHYILEPVDPRQSSLALQNREDLLILVLHENAETDFGRHYGFGQMFSAEDYRRTVPLQSYRDYAYLVSLSQNVGEPRLLSQESAAAYAGIYGYADKRIPVPMTNALCDQMGTEFLKKCEGEITFLMIGSLTGREVKNDGAYEDTLFSIILRNAIGTLPLKDIEKADCFTAPPKLIFSQACEGTYYLNLLIALRNPEVTQIYAGNSWFISIVLRMLQNIGDVLCSDIANGTVSHGGPAVIELGRQLKGLCLPDPERAEAIRSALHGSRADVLRSIWPKLKRVVARTGGNYALYSQQLADWFRNVPLTCGDFYTPFGVIGYGQGQDNRYRLAEDAAFYEFLPVEPSESKETLLRTQLETGRTYELVVSNAHGIYRLVTGIYIRPVQITPQEMVFEEACRPVRHRGTLLYGGEVLDAAMQAVLGAQLRDYTFYFDEEKQSMVLIPIVEDGQAVPANAAEELDRRLRAAVQPGARDMLAGLAPCTLAPAEEKELVPVLKRFQEETDFSMDAFAPSHGGISRKAFQTLARLWEELKAKRTPGGENTVPSSAAGGTCEEETGK